MDVLLSFLPGGALTAAAGVVAVVLAAIWRAVTLGRSLEQAKSAKRDAAAKDDQLEMYRDATDIERQTRDLSDEEARREALKWAKR